MTATFANEVTEQLSTPQTRMDPGIRRDDGIRLRRHPSPVTRHPSLLKLDLRDVTPPHILGILLSVDKDEKSSVRAVEVAGSR